MHRVGCHEVGEEDVVDRLEQVLRPVCEGGCEGRDEADDDNGDSLAEEGGLYVECSSF